MRKKKSRNARARPPLPCGPRARRVRERPFPSARNAANLDRLKPPDSFGGEEAARCCCRRGKPLLPRRARRRRSQPRCLRRRALAAAPCLKRWAAAAASPPFSRRLFGPPGRHLVGPHGGSARCERFREGALFGEVRARAAVRWRRRFGAARWRARRSIVLARPALLISLLDDVRFELREREPALATGARDRLRECFGRVCFGLGCRDRRP